MRFDDVFPLRFWINLGRRGDRRGETEWRLADAGITAERFPAVDARFVANMSLQRRIAQRHPCLPVVDHNGREMDGTLVDSTTTNVRGYEHAGRYALALTQRLAIREAKARNADAVLLFEDDVILHPNFRELVASLNIPDDWGMFFFGCQHGGEPIPCAPGIVRAKYAFDTHAVAIRKRYYNQVLRALDGHGKALPNHPLASDRYLAALEGDVPTYACFPNLAWQANSNSDLISREYTHYKRGGTQKLFPGIVDQTFSKMAGVQQVEGGAMQPKLGLLFLTRGDVNHPAIWREFVEGAPSGVEVFSHSKFPEMPEDAFLEDTKIEEHYETAWGEISLVVATLALLRASLKDRSISHFVLLSESCVPLRPLSEMLRHLRLSPRSRFGWKEFDSGSDLLRARASFLPNVPRGCWKFQSQWWLLEREAAEWVVSADYTCDFAAMPIPDEAYFGTVLSLLGYPVEDRVVNVDITWASWKEGEGSPESFIVVPQEKVEAMIESGAWFSRKFPVGSDIGIWGLHRH